MGSIEVAGNQPSSTMLATAVCSFSGLSCTTAPPYAEIIPSVVDDASGWQKITDGRSAAAACAAAAAPWFPVVLATTPADPSNLATPTLTSWSLSLCAQVGLSVSFLTSTVGPSEVTGTSGVGVRPRLTRLVGAIGCRSTLSHCSTERSSNSRGGSEPSYTTSSGACSPPFAQRSQPLKAGPSGCSLPQSMQRNRACGFQLHPTSAPMFSSSSGRIISHPPRLLKPRCANVPRLLDDASSRWRRPPATSVPPHQAVLGAISTRI